MKNLMVKGMGIRDEVRRISKTEKEKRDRGEKQGERKEGKKHGMKIK